MTPFDAIRRFIVVFTRTQWLDLQIDLYPSRLRPEFFIHFLSFPCLLRAMPCHTHFYLNFITVAPFTADPSCRAVWRVGLRRLACWDCGFESHRGHGCLSVVSVACCQVEVSATSWSLVQRSPTVVCKLETSWMRRPWPTGGVAPKTNKQAPFTESTSYGVSQSPFRLWNCYTIALSLFIWHSCCPFGPVIFLIVCLACHFGSHLIAGYM